MVFYFYGLSIMDPSSNNGIVINPCDSSDYLYKKHKCRFCDYRTNYPHVLRRHEADVHKAVPLPPGKKGGGGHKPKAGVIVDNHGRQIDTSTQTEEAVSYNIQLCPFFKCFICGPSRSGKTYFIQQLLSNLSSFTKQTPTKVILVFSQYQYGTMQNLNLVDLFLQAGGDNFEREFEKAVKNQHCLVIFDDQMNDTKMLSLIGRLFSVEGRHSKMSLIFISQKIFLKNEGLRIIRENSDYYILFRNPLNISSVGILSQQMTKNSTLADIYQHATQSPFSYLFIDLRQESVPETKYLSKLFDRNFIVNCYLVNNMNNNKYSKKTKFSQMFLVNENELDNIINEPTEQSLPMDQKEPEKDHTVEAYNVLPPPTISDPVKRKREDANDEEDTDAKRTRLDQTNANDKSDHSIATAHVSNEKPPLESVMLPPPQPSLPSTTTHSEGERDMNYGADDDILKARQRGLETEEASPIKENVTPSSTDTTSFRPNQCEICGKSFSSPRGVKIHKKRMHFMDQNTSNVLVSPSRKRTLIKRGEGE